METQLVELSNKEIDILMECCSSAERSTCGREFTVERYQRDQSIIERLSKNKYLLNVETSEVGDGKIAVTGKLSVKGLAKGEHSDYVCDHDPFEWNDVRKQFEWDYPGVSQTIYYRIVEKPLAQDDQRWCAKRYEGGLGKTPTEICRAKVWIVKQCCLNNSEYNLCFPD